MKTTPLPPEVRRALEMAEKLIPIARRHFPKSIHNHDKFTLEQTCAAIGTALHAMATPDEPQPGAVRPPDETHTTEIQPLMDFAKREGIGE